MRGFLSRKKVYAVSKERSAAVCRHTRGELKLGRLLWAFLSLELVCGLSLPPAPYKSASLFAWQMPLRLCQSSLRCGPDCFFQSWNSPVVCDVANTMQPTRLDEIERSESSRLVVIVYAVESGAS